MNHICKYLIFCVSVFSAVTYFRKLPNENEAAISNCFLDLIRNLTVCQLVCPYGTFALPGMTYCHPWLNCNDKITVIKTLSKSVVKTVYLGLWKDYEVVLSVLSAKDYEEDFKHNLFMLKSFHGSSLVTQLIGFCYNNIVTQYYKLGNALNTNHHLNYTLKEYNIVRIRLNLCISYVSIISFLHSSPLGVRVMCDSSTLEKTLSQYLLREDLTLIINDLDAIPEVNYSNKGIVCGNRALTGSFVAPEQLWPFPDEEFSTKKMPFYDEKTDIWKIPDVCNWFLGNSHEADWVKYKTFHLHKRCKEEDPTRRPNASAIGDFYEKIHKEL